MVFRGPQKETKSRPPVKHAVRLSDDKSHFEVRSANSGNVYAVKLSDDGKAVSCTTASTDVPCVGFSRRGKCSHIEAALDMAIEAIESTPPKTDS